MGFVLGALLMWFALWVMSRKPLKVWLPVGGAGGLIVVQVLHRWTDLATSTGWAEGWLVGGLTGVVALEVARRRRNGKDRKAVHQ